MLIRLASCANLDMPDGSSLGPMDSIRRQVPTSLGNAAFRAGVIEVKSASRATLRRYWATSWLRWLRVFPKPRPFVTIHAGVRISDATRTASRAQLELRLGWDAKSYT